MYLVKTPSLVKPFFKDLLWKVDTKQKEIFLTFDDGPTPEVTSWVLEVLSIYNAKATFFCIGENVQKYPKIFQQIVDGGHAVGNHTQNHLNGWKTNDKVYLENVEACENQFNSNYFRPPYGKATKNQIKVLKEKYKVVMWDVLSADFDVDCNAEQCSENVIKNAKEGSIVVFHDSVKAFEKIKIALPTTLKYFAEQGYSFPKLP